MGVVVLDNSLTKKEELALPASYEDINPHNLYLYIKAYLSNIRANSAHTKNRSAVRGGGRKPWSQKGGGRARQGSIRAPQFVGGGVAHGPTNNKNYFQKINKKQKKLALKFALAQKAKEGRLFIVDEIKIESGKTKDAAEFVKKISQRELLVVNKRMNFANEEDIKTFLAFRNLKNAYLIEENELEAYILSAYYAVVMVREVYEKLTKEG
jgi:large subunit ribosomal protein L4